MNQPPLPQHPFKSKHFIASLGYACRGIHAVFKTERNFKFHTMMTMLVFLMGIFFRISWLEWILLILCVTVMLVVEILNTAIEYLVDSYYDGIYDVKARITKDIAAGACLIAALGTAMVGCVIVLHHIGK